MRASFRLGEKPTAEGGYFAGSMLGRTTRSGWLLFPRAEPGPRAAHIIYDFGDRRITFSFPPILRR